MGAVRGPTKKLGSLARRVFRMPQSRLLRDVPNDCDRRNNEGCAKRAQPERRKQNANPSPAPVRFIESPIATAPLPGVNPLSFARE
jgi:hypothetical protein